MSNRIEGLPHAVARILMILVVFGIITSDPNVSQAKGGEEQDEIILLNDSAAALEDTNPGISKSLTQFADDKEKEWEIENANKNGPPSPVIDKNIKQIQQRIKLLNTAALAVQQTYPLIAKSLIKMADDMNKTIENEK